MAVHTFLSSHALAGVPFRGSPRILLGATHLPGAGTGGMEVLGGGLAWRRSSSLAGRVPPPDYLNALQKVIQRRAAAGLLVPEKEGLLRLDELIESPDEMAIVHSLTPEGLAEADPAELAERLSEMGTRLLVMEGAPQELDELAAALVKAGGPATLAVRAVGGAFATKKYFSRLYHELSRGAPLAEAAAPTKASLRKGLETELFLGRDADELAIIPAMTRTRRAGWSYRDPRVYAPPPAKPGRPGAPVRARPPGPEPEEAGAEEEEEQEERGPRVLNANFRAAGADAMLEPREALHPGTAYDLLVDVGPRWARNSLVEGNARFPTEALPPSDDGWVVQVALVSEDFEPSTATGEIFVPAAGGVSSPVLAGERQSPGPLALRIHLRDVREAEAFTRAFGRLCLYHGAALLQSAEVDVGVSAAGAPLDEPNTIRVDYVFSGTFQALDEVATRRMGRGAGDPGALRELPVAVSVTLNGDGAGRHRLIVKSANGASAPADPPPGWMPYDPIGSRELLRQARSELRNCFFTRTATGVEKTFGLGPDNSRSYDQFRRDLRELALLGYQLHAAATGAVEVDASGEDEAELSVPAWKRLLRAALADRSVIQVARTGPANYVFPWALVYDIPMPGPEFRFCPVVAEWEHGSRPATPERTRCPHEDRHDENLYCPYGFWGLKHYIEQPPSTMRRVGGEMVVRDSGDVIIARPALDVAIGATADARIDAARLRAHWQALDAIAAKIPLRRAGPAGDIDAVRALVADAGVVYFLCHGKEDPLRNSAYLGIGPDTDDPRYKLYPFTVDGWAETPTPPNLERWAKRRPLVIINGCSTAELEPGKLLSFVTSFTNAGASGVVGTEIPVELALAEEIGSRLFRGLADGREVGQILYDIRWSLANRGNLLGLAYTVYARTDLHVMH